MNVNDLEVKELLDIYKILLEYLEYILYSNKMYNGVCAVERAISRLKRNGNYDIVIDNMILKIIDEI